MALEMKTACERCGAALATDGQAMICAFECTFCADCASNVFVGACPNCGGEFSRRPVRPAGKLVKYPASTQRVLRDGDCVAMRKSA